MKMLFNPVIIMNENLVTCLMFTLSFVCLLGFELFMVTNAEAESRDASPSAPELSCQIAGIENSDNQPIKVSNLKRVPLKISLSGSKMPLEELTIAPLNKAANAPEKPTLELTVDMLLNNQKIKVPTKLLQIGSSQEYNTYIISTLLEIPVDEAKRKADIVDYVQFVERASIKADNEGKGTLNLFRQKRDYIIAALGNLYMENRVGIFEVKCKYTSHRPGFWNGEIEADPVRIEVRFEGSFFAQPNFQLKAESTSAKNLIGELSASAPELSCQIVGVENSDNQPIKVSNLKRVRLKISLSGTKMPLEELTIAPLKNAANAPEKPTLELTVDMLLNNQKIRVPTRLRRLGSGQAYNTYTIYIRLEIPVDEAKRKADIVNYVQRVEAEGIKSGNESKDTLNLIRQNRDYIIAGLGRLYMENRVGIFEVRCKYTSHRQGFWNGEVESDPLRIEVVSEGNFFDQPNFQPTRSK